MSAIYKLESNRAFSSIRKGFVMIIPIILTGTICVLLRSFPIPIYQTWLAEFGGGVFYTLLSYIIDATTGLMSIYLSLSIAYNYAASTMPSNTSMHMLSMFNAFACFAASFGAASGSLTLSSFGTLGVFTAILCSVFATKLLFLLTRALSRGAVKGGLGTDDQYTNSVNAILPVFVCVAFFALMNYLLVTLFGVSDLNQLISNGLLHMFSGIRNELAVGALFTFMMNMLWVFGIHGGNAMDPVAQTVFVDGQAEILTKSFIDNFTVLGGCGATLCLVIALFIVSKSRRNRGLAKSAAPMVLFNINEIMVFGFPLVMNPVMAIPFITVPLVSLLIAYFAAVTGFMPIVENAVHWTTPAILGGYVFSGSITGAITQLVIVLVGTLIYIPFVRFAEKIDSRRMTHSLEELTKEFKKHEQSSTPMAYLSRHDNVGTIAKALVTQLRGDIILERLDMSYQPIVDQNRCVAGAEALLRWRFGDGPVYPPMVIALAKEAGCLDELTWGILETVMRDVREIIRRVPSTMFVSLNVVAEQLEDASFINKFIIMAEKYGVNHNLIVEVTEETSLAGMKNIAKHIELLHLQGIRTAIDDFGMGQTSLDYLRNNTFDYVKLDGSLVTQIADNPRCRDIIRSILALGQNLRFHPIAEHVEDEAMEGALKELDCHLFQGYLFSPAIRLEPFIEYTLAHSPALPEEAEEPAE